MELAQLNLALDRICQNIGGDWLLLGGSLVRLAVDPERGTHDIDIVQIPLNSNPRERIQLIHEMRAIGLSPEQVNSAVGYFLSQIPAWQNELIEILSLGKGRIFRPTLTLFAFMKIQRGTPLDFEDIKHALNKWGCAEFNSETFAKLANPTQIETAKALGLLKV